MCWNRGSVQTRGLKLESGCTSWGFACRLSRHAGFRSEGLCAAIMKERHTKCCCGGDDVVDDDRGDDKVGR